MLGTPGIVRGRRLAFTLPGPSPAEPAFASLDPDDTSECHGVVYSLRPLDWLRLCASEGVPWAYRVVTVPVDLYNGQPQVQAYSLQANVGRIPGFSLKPSARYLNLLLEGAREAGLRPEWIDKLESIRPAEPWRLRDLPRDYENRPGETFI